MFQPNRLFLALWPDEVTRQALHRTGRELLMKMQPGGRRVSVENIHLTLIFLGDAIPPEVELELRHAMRDVQADPFKLELDVASAFKNTKVWWLGCREAPDAVFDLRQSIHECLKGITVTTDRKKFAPHITILRDVDVPLAPHPVAPVSWGVTEFALVRSRLDDGPPRYEVIERWPLRRTKPPAPQQMSLI